jgi:hypothetical protein
MAWTPRLIWCVRPSRAASFAWWWIAGFCVNQEVRNTYSVVSYSPSQRKEKEKDYVYKVCLSIFHFSFSFFFPCPPSSLRRPGRVRDGTQDFFWQPYLYIKQWTHTGRDQKDTEGSSNPVQHHIRPLTIKPRKHHRSPAVLWAENTACRRQDLFS